MFLEDDEEFDLVGKTSIEEEETTEEKAEEVDEEAPDTDIAEEEESKSDETETTEEPVQGDNRVKALTAERARRKNAERELRELKAQIEAEKNAKSQEEQISKEREAYKKKMLEGDLVDEDVAEKLLDVFGDDIIKNKLITQAREEAENFDKELAELKKDDLFMDADVYKPQIKELMGKGLSMEEAYFASVGKSRFSQMKKDMEVELEQKLLNNDKKADEVDIGHAEEKGVIKRGKYTKREQEIARETGLTVEEVHKRYIKPNEVFSIEDIENL